MNRGWRFCRPYRVVDSDAWLRLLVPDDSRFYVVFGCYCSEVAPKSTPTAASVHRCPARQVDGGNLSTVRASGSASADAQQDANPPIGISSDHVSTAPGRMNRRWETASYRGCARAGRPRRSRTRYVTVRPHGHPAPVVLVSCKRWSGSAGAGRDSLRRDSRVFLVPGGPATR